MDLKNKNVRTALLVVIVATVVFIAGLIMLPSNLILQTDSAGVVTRSAPKLLGLGLPSLLSLFFSFIYVKSPENSTGAHGMFIAFVGIAVNVFIFFFNL